MAIIDAPYTSAIILATARVNENKRASVISNMLLPFFL